MRIRLNDVLICLILMVFSACDNDDPFPEPPAKGEERTVLVYWVGDNSSNDLSSFAISDFNEMVEGVKNVDVTKHNVVVYSQVKGDVPHLIHISKVSGKVVADTVYTYPDQNPLEMAVMSKVISTVMADFPAKSYGLVFASHADGWLEAPSSANTTRHLGDYRGTQMNITDLRTVLGRFKRLEFILFDACYMQAIEVAYELKDCADYIISSPTEIPGPGAPYQVVVPLMFSDSDVGINIARAYYEYYGNDDKSIKTDAKYIWNGSEQIWEHGVSVSVLKTSKLDALATATANILEKYAEDKTIVNTSGMLFYGSYSNGGYYYDMDAVIAGVTGNNADNPDYVFWRHFFDEAQPYFKTTFTNYAKRRNGSFSMVNAEGVSMYVPNNKTSTLLQYYRELRWYEDGNVWKSSGW